MANFTPQEIEEMLQEFFDTVGKRQYVGARYVPLVGRKGDATTEWDGGVAAYEPLTIVTYQGDSYTSKTYVPVGIQITDTNYWVRTAGYNAQVEQYRRDMIRALEQVAETDAELRQFVHDNMDSKLPWPTGSDSKYGSVGQVLGTKVNGNTEWVDPVTITPEVAGPIIEDWLDNHPEATTTVEDNSITSAKIADGAVNDVDLNQTDGVLPSIYELNSYMIPFTNRVNATNNGCNLTWDGRKCTIAGTPTSPALFNLIREPSFEGQIHAGDSFFIEPSGNAEIAYSVFEHANGAWVEPPATYNNSDGKVKHTLSNTCDGYLIRILVRTTFNGNPYTFEPRFYTRQPNFENYGESEFIHIGASLPANTDLNDIVENSIYYCSSGRNYLHTPDFSSVATGALITYKNASIVTQLWIDYDPRFTGENVSTRNVVGYRTKQGTNSWTAWSDLLGGVQKNITVALPSGSINDAPINTTYILTSSNTYTEMPDSSLDVGILSTMKFTGWKYQIFYELLGGSIYTRAYNPNTTTWSVWRKISGGNNVTNVFNEYQNTYNVTATPSITSDTNNYLAPSGDTTDRTNDILTMLANGGTCKLGAGTYYISELVMPENSSIIGSGNNSILRVANGATFGVRLSSYCTVSQLRIWGADSGQSYWDNTAIENRHAILWQGNYTQTQDGSQQPKKGCISDVYIQHFSGGGITCYDTGYGESNSLLVDNVFIEDCFVGINISYWSEYSLYSNVQCHRCNIACLNNGGNNMFSNCGFSVNKRGFVIDNTNSDGRNMAHGSASNCTINHINSNQGTAVEIINVNAGFVFSSCQFFFSDIVLTNADGVVFDGCNFGTQNNDINISGGHAAIFSNCLFGGQPTKNISNNSSVIFSNCMVRSTGEYVTV